MAAIQYCGFTLCSLPPVTEQVLDLTTFPLCLHHLSTLVPFSEEPKDAAAYESLAEVYQREAKFADAAALLTKALALRKTEKDPLVFDTAYQLAYIQVTYLECPELAIPHLRSNLAIASPQSFPAMQCVKLLAQALLDTYDYQEANRILSESVSHFSDSPDLARIHNLQAWCLQLQGYKDQAEYRLLQSLERVEKQWPGSEVEAETWLYLASVSKTALYAEQALEYYNNSLLAVKGLVRSC
jgi:tetratricopeptide (TPR) repeat protein